MIDFDFMQISLYINIIILTTMMMMKNLNMLYCRPKSPKLNDVMFNISLPCAIKINLTGFKTYIINYHTPLYSPVLPNSYGHNPIELLVYIEL